MGSEPLTSDVVQIKVGPRQRLFILDRGLLCSASPYFRERLRAAPAKSPASVIRAPSGHAASTNVGAASSTPREDAVLWLSTELPDVFELFVLWLRQPRAFSSFTEAAITQLDPDTCSAAISEESHETSRRTLHWTLVRLHLFAAKTAIPALQDAAMDALQDLYLRCDWEVSPSFVRFLYAECYAEHAFRMRKWAVAMTAWTVAMQGGEPTDDWQRLLDNHPVLHHDYHTHLRKMAGSRGANICIKNPQLRLPANRLRSEERFFGFRQCSFHSHRSAVGERPCPHDTTAKATVSSDVKKAHKLSPPPASAPRRARDDAEVKSDESSQKCRSPVSLYIREGFYLDVS